MTTVYGFADRRDVADLIGLLRRIRSEPRTRSRVHQQHGVSSLAGYLVKTGSGGVTAMSGTTPGSGTCTIWRRGDAGTLTLLSDDPEEQAVVVYNLHAIAIPGETYHFASQTADGDFWLTGVVPFQDIRFTLAAALATSDASKTATIAEQEGPGQPSTSTGAGAITVLNPQTSASGVYIFRGDNGDRGIAKWISGTTYRIENMECP